MSEGNIPESLQQVAIEIAAICRKHKLRMCDATLRPGWDDDFHDKVQLSWSEGRHGADVDNLSLSYERNVRVTLPPESP